MELDSLPVCDSGSPAAGVPKKKPETLKSCLKTPTESSDPGSSGESVVSAASSVPIGPRKRSSVGMSLPICDTPFAYMLRGMRSVACVTEEHEFFDCDQGVAEVFELDFPELCCGDHDFACSGSRMLAAPPGRTHDLCSRTHDLCIRTHDLCSRTHDLCGRTHDLSSRMHDLSSRMHDLGSCRLSESVLCRMQVAMSQCLKVARHGLKVAQRVLRVLCPYLRAGFCQALRFHSAEASELNSGERCFPERERSERFPSRRHLVPKLLFLTLLVLWGYDGPYGGGCYASGSVGSGSFDASFRNNGFGRSMGTMGSDTPSHGSIGIHSSRCTSYSHGSLGIYSSRCTSYSHGSLGIYSSRCTSYSHGSLAIHSSRCTSYVSGPPFRYHAKRWLEYGASGSGDATNQVCCKSGRRKALRLCQLVEVSIYVGSQISGRAVWCHELGCGFFVEVHQILVGPSRSRRGTNFRQHRRDIPARICSSKSNANGILRAGGAGMAKIPTRPCKCKRNRGYSRPNGGWREIFAGVRKIAPIGARMGRSKAHCGGRISYAAILCQRPRCPSAVLTVGRCADGTGSSEHYGSGHIDQRLGAGSRQTFCNGPHWDYHPINGDRGVDASKLRPKFKIWEGCPCADARGSPPDGVHPYVAALQRDASVSPGAAIESIGGRNRGGVRELCCFEQHTCSIHRLLRLSGIIWGWVYPPIGTCASSTTTAYFGSRGTGSWPGTTIGCWCYRYDWAGDYVSPRQCLGDRTAEVYGLAVATAAGGGAFTLAGPGVSSAGGGIVSDQTNRAVFVAHIALERADEVVYNPWIGCTGVVREAYQFVASQDPRTSASAPRPAKRGTSLRCRHNKGPLLDWGLWRMFKPMFGWWKMRNPEQDWFLGGPRFELWNLKDKTPKRPRPNRTDTPLLLPRQKNWWCHMDSGVSGSAWLVSGSAWFVSGSACLEGRSGSAWSVKGSLSCGSGRFGRLCSAWSERFAWLSVGWHACSAG